MAPFFILLVLLHTAQAALNSNCTWVNVSSLDIKGDNQIVELYPVPTSSCQNGLTNGVVAQTIFPVHFDAKFPDVASFQKLDTYFQLSNTDVASWRPFFFTLDYSDSINFNQLAILRQFFNWQKYNDSFSYPPKVLSYIQGADVSVDTDPQIFIEVDFGEQCVIDKQSISNGDIQHVFAYEIIGQTGSGVTGLFYRWCDPSNGLGGGYNYGDAVNDGCQQWTGDPGFDLFFYFKETKTPAPTFSPSDTPTSPPSISPTAAPSDSPSSPPSIAPSLSPVISPSNSPSSPPSLSPSDSPVTLPPSVSPSGSPTVVPTPEPTKTPTIDAYSQNSDTFSWLIGSVLVVCVLIAIIGLLHSRYPTLKIWLCCNMCCYPSDDADYMSVIRFGFQTTDFMSDIILTYALLLKGGEDPSYNIFYYCSLIFVLLPWGANLMFLIAMSRKWTNMRGGVKAWMRTYTTILVFFTMISGGANASVAVVNSKLFGLTAFSMGLPKSLFLNSNRFRVVLTTLLENIPQVAIQIAYGSRSGFGQSALLLALTTSSISILLVVVSSCVQLSDDYKDKEFEIIFTLGKNDRTNNLKAIERNCHMRKRLGNLLCRAFVISDKLLIVENVIIGANDVTITFELNDDRDIVEILDGFKKTISDDSLANAIQDGLSLDEKPVSTGMTIKLVAIQDTAGGEQEMTVTGNQLENQIATNKPLNTTVVVSGGLEDNMDDGPATATAVAKPPPNSRYTSTQL